MICNATYRIKHTDKWHEEMDLVNGVTEKLNMKTATGRRGHWGQHLLMGTDGDGKTVNSPRESFLFSWGLLIKILKLPMDMEQLVVACFTDDKLKVINWATEGLRESSLSPEFQPKNLATTCISPKGLEGRFI